MSISGKNLVAALSILVASFACGLQADVVHWGGNYVANDSQNLSGNTFLGGFGGNGYSGTHFSTTTEFSPPVSAAYNGPSARFYGGAIMAHENDTMTGDAFDNARIKNQGGHDSVQLKASQAGHRHSMHAIFLWQQADFLTGNSPITFNAMTTASLTIGQASTETVRDASLRLIVRDQDDNYWLSGHSFTGLANNTSYTWDSSNQGFGAATDGMWAAYDPTQSLGTLGAGTDLHFDVGSAMFMNKDFAGINAVGFFFDQDIFHNNLEFHWERFRLVIPEPGSLALLALCSVIGLIPRRVR